VAVYEKEIEVKENMLQDRVALRLDLGKESRFLFSRSGPACKPGSIPPVREAAVVYVNVNGRVGLVPAILA